MKTFLSYIGKKIFRLTGWTYDEIPACDWHDKQVFIGFPHTSNMDTVMAFTYSKATQINAKVLIKSDWFVWPMSSFLNALGGMPIVRDKDSGFVGNVVKEFQKREKLILAIVPEGTRKKTIRIKTGFWNIAKAANVPVACWFYDNRHKKMTWVGHIKPGDDLVTDLLKIKKMYQRHGHEIPLRSQPVQNRKVKTTKLNLHPEESTIITNH